jgi:hypothetical protein
MSEQTLSGKWTPTEKGPRHARGQVFEVAECEFDFIGKGKKEPAVEITRLPSGQRSTMRRARFLEEFAPVAAE